jgi:uncharacterized lipoprotein YajG
MCAAMKKIVEVTTLPIVIVWTLFMVGCTPVYKPIYTPTDIFYEDLQEMPIKLQVLDDREENKKVFYKNYPITVLENSKSGVILEPSSREIIERSLLKAMGASGYSVKDNVPIVMDVYVKEFVWCFNHYAIIFGQSFTADIKVEVVVKKNDKIFIKKTIAETVERKSPIANMGQEEKMLSECLTKVVEKLISDYNIIEAIRRAYKSNIVGK